MADDRGDSDPDPRARRQPFFVRYWWVTLARGVVILVLGVALLIGANTRSRVATFFALYWITTGLVAIQWSLAPTHRRLPLVVLASGIVGTFAGIAVLSRTVSRSLFSAELAVGLIGTTALLVGILRIAGGFRTEPMLKRRWGWDSLLLGMFEVVLGIALLVGYAGSRSLIIPISAWAIGAGLVLLLDAWQLRRAARDQTNG